MGVTCEHQANMWIQVATELDNEQAQITQRASTTTSQRICAIRTRWFISFVCPGVSVRVHTRFLSVHILRVQTMAPRVSGVLSEGSAGLLFASSPTFPLLAFFSLYVLVPFYFSFSGRISLREFDDALHRGCMVKAG